jgi:pilus assembly protein CpaD
MPNRCITTIALLTLGLSGCGTAPPTFPNTTEMVHPIQVEVIARDLDLDIDSVRGTIPAAERNRIRAAVTEQGRDTALHATVQGQLLAAPAQRGVARLLIEAGVAAENIAFQPGETPGTTLHLTRYTAKAKTCAPWPDIHDNRYANLPTTVLGCANQANLARMLADPHDLVEGRPTQPMDGARAAAAVQRYRADKVKKLPSESATNTFVLAPLAGAGAGTP